MNKLTTTLATVSAALLLVTQLLLSIDDLLLRVSQAPGQRLIITDGVETCRPAGLTPIPPPAADTRSE